jgi:hypothetical protein
MEIITIKASSRPPLNVLRTGASGRLGLCGIFMEGQAARAEGLAAQITFEPVLATQAASAIIAVLSS